MGPSAAGAVSAIQADWAAHGCRADDVAAAAAALWGAIGAALAPIVGLRGVSALYSRCLHVAGAAHPALAEVYAVTSPAADYTALQAVLSDYTAAEACQINAALLGEFSALLASLIGAQLTDRLLARAVHDHHSSGTPAQDTLP